MLRLIFVLAATLLPVSAAAADIHVVDGDTFRLDGATIRIENIDAPELKGARCSAEARLARASADRLAALLRSGELDLSRNPNDRRNADRYGRLLRRVAVNGVDVGATLVSEGLARPWTGRRANWC